MIKNLSKLFNQVFKRNLESLKLEEGEYAVILDREDYTLRFDFYGLFSVDRQNEIKGKVIEAIERKIPKYHILDVIKDVDPNLVVDMVQDKEIKKFIIEIKKIKYKFEVNEVQISSDILSYDETECLKDIIKAFVLNGNSLEHIQKFIETTVNCNCECVLNDDVLEIEIASNEF